MRTNQQKYHNYEINIFLPRTPYSQLNHTIEWLVTVLLWCSYAKTENYIRLFHAVQQPNETKLLFINLSITFVIGNTIQANQLKHATNNKNLLMRPNQQEDKICEINSLVPRMPCSQLNHTIYWLVTVMLWCCYKKPMNYKGRSPPSQWSPTWWNKTGLSKLASSLCWLFDVKKFTKYLFL